MPYCHQCGVQVSETVVFCSACGTKQVVDIANTSASPVSSTSTPSAPNLATQNVVAATNRTVEPFPVFGTIALGLAVVGLFLPVIVSGTLAAIALVMSIVAIGKKEKVTGVIALIVSLVLLGFVIHTYMQVQQALGNFEKEMKQLEKSVDKDMKKLEQDLRNLK